METARKSHRTPLERILSVGVYLYILSAKRRLSAVKTRLDRHTETAWESYRLSVCAPM